MTGEEKGPWTCRSRGTPGLGQRAASICPRESSARKRTIASVTTVLDSEEEFEKLLDHSFRGRQ